MDLKLYYDAVVNAEADVQSILTKMDEHFQAGEKEQALALRPSLEAAKAQVADANEIYLMMRGGSESVGVAKRFVPAGRVPQKANAVNRAEFESLLPAERAEFVRAGGVVVDGDA